MESKSIFLDTNIVLDILNAGCPYNEDAKSLWKMLVLNGYQIIISEDMLSTIYYIEKDKEKVLEFFKLIQKRWKIVSFGDALIGEAITMALEQKLDLEDTLQCLCAKAYGCGVLVTNDKSFVECGIEIVNYERFLK